MEFGNSAHFRAKVPNRGSAEGTVGRNERPGDYSHERTCSNDEFSADMFLSRTLQILLVGTRVTWVSRRLETP